MKLSVIIPCYNEEDTIKIIIEKVISVPIEKEIVVVDDFSNDGTRIILKNEIESKVNKVLFLDKNCGKGYAIKKGIEIAEGDAIVIQDADLEYDPNDYIKLTNDIFSNNAEVVYGSRFLHQRKKGYLANRVANSFLTWLSNVFTHQKLTDMETCYKCFKREIIQSINLEENRFGFEPEVTSKISKLGIKIREVPISYNPRTNQEGKKINFKDGLRAIYCIFKYK